jgi:hypothetical protein
MEVFIIVVAEEATKSQGPMLSSLVPALTPGEKCKHKVEKLDVLVRSTACVLHDFLNLIFLGEVPLI